MGRATQKPLNLGTAAFGCLGERCSPDYDGRFQIGTYWKIRCSSLLGDSELGLQYAELRSAGQPSAAVCTLKRAASTQRRRPGLWQE